MRQAPLEIVKRLVAPGCIEDQESQRFPEGALTLACTHKAPVDIVKFLFDHELNPDASPAVRFNSSPHIHRGLLWTDFFFDLAGRGLAHSGDLERCLG
jgi:hypothetical protein